VSAAPPPDSPSDRAQAVERRRARPSVDEQLRAQQATPAQHQAVRELTDQLYGHVVRTIDAGAVDALEQMLATALHDRGVRHDHALTAVILADLLGRFAHDPSRGLRAAPAGITDDEIVAATYTETCPFCRHDLAVAERRARHGRGPDPDDEAWDQELLELDAAAATRWREEHAAALRRFGLAR
jgi:hypothetical protein